MLSRGLLNSPRVEGDQFQQQPLNQNVNDLIDRAIPELLQMYEGEDNKYVPWYFAREASLHVFP